MTKLSLNLTAPGAIARQSPPKTNTRAKAVSRKRLPFVIGRIINGRGLAVFTRQLATLVRAGMPILRGLEVLGRQEKSPVFRLVIESLAEAIRSGGNFSDGLAANPRVFDRLYVNMVRAGEAGGVLDTVLERLAVFMEKAQRIKGRVRAALTYPVIILFVAAGIVSALMVFVVPMFEKIFTDQLRGRPLPALTQAVVSASNFLKQHFLVALGLLAAGCILGRILHRTRRGARLVDWLLIHLPALGDLFLKTAVARFTRTFGTLLASGVPILQALLITRDTTGNIHVANAINAVHDRVKEGDSVAPPLAAARIFPGMVVSMIEVGEETGALSDMLTRIADIYDEEIDNAVAALTSTLEPIMIVLMALMVGTIVVAMVLPIMSIIQSLG